MSSDIAFGPVPSRRLGRSLGINNIPPKHCSYACRYCQVGPTHDKLITPRPFYSPEEIASAVSRRVALALFRKTGMIQLGASGSQVDTGDGGA